MTAEPIAESSSLVVVRLAEPTVDVVSRRAVEARLRAAPPSAPLVIDWSNVVYVDLLGMETVFEFLLQRAGPVAFAGLSRDLKHLLLRLQLLPVVPRGETVEEAARSIGGAA